MLQLERLALQDGGYATDVLCEAKTMAELRGFANDSERCDAQYRYRWDRCILK